MTLDDLGHLGSVPMPAGVDVLRVAVRPGVPGYPLEPALRLATEYGEAAPAAAVRDLELEASLLRSLPGIQFFAGVTQDGECVATAGSRVVGGAALVASVATHPSARRRGIGTAMTAVALRAAAQIGATEAYLDATAAGRAIYSRLGFAHVGDLLFCERPS
jgi:N-acetylglutamate synthase-like GNAT family acetyltransferase